MVGAGSLPQYQDRGYSRSCYDHNPPVSRLSRVGNSNIPLNQHGVDMEVDMEMGVIPTVDGLFAMLQGVRDEAVAIVMEEVGVDSKQSRTAFELEAQLWAAAFATALAKRLEQQYREMMNKDQA